MTPRPPSSTLFPYTTLFRSKGLPQIGLDINKTTVISSDEALFLEKAPPSLAIVGEGGAFSRDRKSTRLNSSHQIISYAVFCLKKKIIRITQHVLSTSHTTII